MGFCSVACLPPSMLLFMIFFLFLTNFFSKFSCYSSLCQCHMVIMWLYKCFCSLLSWPRLCISLTSGLDFVSARHWLRLRISQTLNSEDSDIDSSYAWQWAGQSLQVWAFTRFLFLFCSTTAMNYVYKFSKCCAHPFLSYINFSRKWAGQSLQVWVFTRFLWFLFYFVLL